MDDIISRLISSLDDFIGNESVKSIVCIHKNVTALAELLSTLRQVPREQFPRHITDILTRVDALSKYKTGIESFLSGDVEKEDKEVMSNIKSVGFATFTKQYQNTLAQLTADLYVSGSSLVDEDLITEEEALPRLEFSLLPVNPPKKSGTFSKLKVNNVLRSDVWCNITRVRYGDFSANYALKIYPSEIDSSTHRKEITAELKRLFHLRHAYTVMYSAYFFSPTRNSLHIVMEWVDAAPLSSFLTSTSPPNELLLVRWLEQSISSLTFLHLRGFVHGNLHPENILVDLTNKVKLTGMETTCVAKHCPMVLQRIRASPYASYERAKGLQYDGRDDVWALGCVWVELIMRRKLEDLMFPATGQLCLVNEQIHDALQDRVREAGAAKAPLLGEFIYKALAATKDRSTMETLLTHSSSSNVVAPSRTVSRQLTKKARSIRLFDDMFSPTRDNITPLVVLLIKGSAEEQELAAEVLWKIAVDPQCKVLIASQPELLPTLLSLIESDSNNNNHKPVATENILGLIMALSTAAANKLKLHQSGFSTALVRIMQTGEVLEQELAVGAISNIAVAREVKKPLCDIPQLLPILVQYISHGSVLQCEHAVGSVLNLAVEPQNMLLLGEKEAKVVEALGRVIASSDREKVVEMALCALGNIAFHPDNKVRILNSDGIVPRIAQLVESGTARQREFGLGALGVVCEYPLLLDFYQSIFVQHRLISVLMVAMQSAATERTLEYCAGCFVMLTKHDKLTEDAGTCGALPMLVQLAVEHATRCAENALEALSIFTRQENNAQLLCNEISLTAIINLFISSERPPSHILYAGLTLKNILKQSQMSSATDDRVVTCVVAVSKTELLSHVLQLVETVKTTSVKNDYINQQVDNLADELLELILHLNLVALDNSSVAMGPSEGTKLLLMTLRQPLQRQQSLRRLVSSLDGEGERDELIQQGLYSIILEVLHDTQIGSEDRLLALQCLLKICDASSDNHKNDVSVSMQLLNMLLQSFPLNNDAESKLTLLCVLALLNNVREDDAIDLDNLKTCMSTLIVSLLSCQYYQVYVRKILHVLFIERKHLFENAIASDLFQSTTEILSKALISYSRNLNICDDVDASYLLDLIASKSLWKFCELPSLLPAICLLFQFATGSICNEISRFGIVNRTSSDWKILDLTLNMMDRVPVDLLQSQLIQLPPSPSILLHLVGKMIITQPHMQSVCDNNTYGDFGNTYRHIQSLFVALAHAVVCDTESSQVYDLAETSRWIQILQLLLLGIEMHCLHPQSIKETELLASFLELCSCLVSITDVSLQIDEVHHALQQLTHFCLLSPQAVIRTCSLRVLHCLSTHPDGALSLVQLSGLSNALVCTFKLRVSISDDCLVDKIWALDILHALLSDSSYSNSSQSSIIAVELIKAGILQHLVTYLSSNIASTTSTAEGTWQLQEIAEAVLLDLSQHNSCLDAIADSGVLSNLMQGFESLFLSDLSHWARYLHLWFRLSKVSSSDTVAKDSGIIDHLFFALQVLCASIGGQHIIVSDSERREMIAEMLVILASVLERDRNFSHDQAQAVRGVLTCIQFTHQKRNDNVALFPVSAQAFQLLQSVLGDMCQLCDSVPLISEIITVLIACSNSPTTTDGFILQYMQLTSQLMDRLTKLGMPASSICQRSKELIRMIERGLRYVCSGEKQSLSAQEKAADGRIVSDGLNLLQMILECSLTPCKASVGSCSSSDCSSGSDHNYLRLSVVSIISVMVSSLPESDHLNSSKTRSLLLSLLYRAIISCSSPDDTCTSLLLSPDIFLIPLLHSLWTSAANIGSVPLPSPNTEVVETTWILRLLIHLVTHTSDYTVPQLLDSGLFLAVVQTILPSSIDSSGCVNDLSNYSCTCCLRLSLVNLCCKHPLFLRDKNILTATVGLVTLAMQSQQSIPSCSASAVTLSCTISSLECSRCKQQALDHLMFLWKQVLSQRKSASEDEEDVEDEVEDHYEDESSVSSLKSLNNVSTIPVDVVSANTEDQQNNVDVKFWLQTILMEQSLFIKLHELLYNCLQINTTINSANNASRSLAAKILKLIVAMIQAEDAQLLDRLTELPLFLPSLFQLLQSRTHSTLEAVEDFAMTLGAQICWHLSATATNKNRLRESGLLAILVHHGLRINSDHHSCETISDKFDSSTSDYNANSSDSKSDSFSIHKEDINVDLNYLYQRLRHVSGAIWRCAMLTENKQYLRDIDAFTPLLNALDPATFLNIFVTISTSSSIINIDVNSDDIDTTHHRSMVSVWENVVGALWSVGMATQNKVPLQQLGSVNKLLSLCKPLLLSSSHSTTTSNTNVAKTDTDDAKNIDYNNIYNSNYYWTTIPRPVIMPTLLLLEHVAGALWTLAVAAENKVVMGQEPLLFVLLTYWLTLPLQPSIADPAVLHSASLDEEATTAIDISVISADRVSKSATIPETAMINANYPINGSQKLREHAAGALWNLSVAPTENKMRICNTPNLLVLIVQLLSLNIDSNTSTTSSNSATSYVNLASTCVDTFNNNNDSNNNNKSNSCIRNTKNTNINHHPNPIPNANTNTNSSHHHSSMLMSRMKQREFAAGALMNVSVTMELKIPVREAGAVVEILKILKQYRLQLLQTQKQNKNKKSILNRLRNDNLNSNSNRNNHNGASDNTSIKANLVETSDILEFNIDVEEDEEVDELEKELEGEGVLVTEKAAELSVGVLANLAIHPENKLFFKDLGVIRCLVDLLFLDRKYNCKNNNSSASSSSNSISKNGSNNNSNTDSNNYHNNKFSNNYSNNNYISNNNVNTVLLVNEGVFEEVQRCLRHLAGNLLCREVLKRYGVSPTDILWTVNW